MTDYTDIPSTNLLVGRPGTTSLMFAFRDNPVSITEGAPDAPKNQSASLAPTFISGLGNVTDTNGIGGAFFMYEARGTSSGTGIYTLRYRTSTNGGVTKTGWTTIGTIVTGGAGVDYNQSFHVPAAFPADTNYVEVGQDGSGSTGLSATGSTWIFGGITIA